jgi:hypothetical protein
VVAPEAVRTREPRERVMETCPQPRADASQCTHCIEIVEPDPDECSDPLPPEGNVKVRNYRMLNDNLRAYTPTGDVNTSPTKGKLVPKFEVCSDISPPRAKILELLRPEDPGREALEAIVRPASRRGLTRPLDDDTRRFLQRALLSPSPQGLSIANTPEPILEKESSETVNEEQLTDIPSREDRKELSLADELREAEEEERTGYIRRDVLREFRRGGVKEAVERERLGKLAQEGLTAAARRLDALLAESRDLHQELAVIQEDIQVLARRVACRDL